MMIKIFSSDGVGMGVVIEVVRAQMTKSESIIVVVSEDVHVS